jgi:hypothetical protein
MRTDSHQQDLPLEPETEGRAPDEAPGPVLVFGPTGSGKSAPFGSLLLSPWMKRACSRLPATFGGPEEEP